MLGIVESINIAESRTNPKEIANYCKSWITSAGTAEEYEAVLHAIKKGLGEGVKDNLKYLKDDAEQAAAKKLDDIITDWNVPSAKLGEWE